MLGTHGTALAVPSISFQPSPSSTTCGSAQNVALSVFDTSGAPAPNNTNVTLTTSLGYINSPVVTTGNLAIASLVIPPKMSGTATVTATALGVSERKSITVTCAASPPAPLFLPALAAFAPAAALPAGATALPPGASATQAVSVMEYSYAPAAFNVRAGQPVSLNVTNVGRLPHTFTIAGVTDSGSIAAGSSRSVQFTAGSPGTLTFFCTIHGANVMSGRMTVTP